MTLFGILILTAYLAVIVISIVVLYKGRGGNNV